MASLESHYGSYRIVFRFAGHKFCHSLKTENERTAKAALARLEDNLARLEMGQLVPPEGVDLATFLLFDGKLSQRPTFKLDAFRTFTCAMRRKVHRLVRNPAASGPARTIWASSCFCSGVSRGGRPRFGLAARASLLTMWMPKDQSSLPRSAEGSTPCGSVPYRTYMCELVARLHSPEFALEGF